MSRLPNKSKIEERPYLTALTIAAAEKKAKIHVQSYAQRLIVLVVFIGVLYVGKTVFLPLIAAILLSLLLRPIVRLLESYRIPSSASSILVILTLTVIIGAIVSSLSEPFQQWVKNLPGMLSHIQNLYRDLRDPVEQLSRAVSDIEQNKNATSVQVVNQDGFIVSYLLANTRDFITITGITLILTYFVLACGEPLICKLMSRVPQLESHDSNSNFLLGTQPMTTATHVLRETEWLMFRYLGTFTIINICLGTCIGFFAAFMQLPNPLLWGVMFFTLNFIPYIGSFIGISAIALMAFTHFDNTWEALAIPVFCFLLTSIEGNLITPTILGKTFSINPLIIFLWTTILLWLWGTPGGLIAVPLLVLFQVLATRIRSLNWVASLMAT